MKLPAVPPTSFDDLTLNFEAIEQQGLFSGSGAPTFFSKKGDYYFRRDTPGTAGQMIYVNTADGVNWTGIV